MNSQFHLHLDIAGHLDTLKKSLMQFLSVRLQKSFTSCLNNRFPVSFFMLLGFKEHVAVMQFILYVSVVKHQMVYTCPRPAFYLTHLGVSVN